jgi:hypothetical protein
MVRKLRTERDYQAGKQRMVQDGFRTIVAYALETVLYSFYARHVSEVVDFLELEHHSMTSVLLAQVKKNRI